MWKQVLKRELEVAVHAQTLEFRLAKYIVLVAFFGLVYWWGGWALTWKVLLAALLFALCVHFYYRSMTDTWTRPWGGYEPKE